MYTILLFVLYWWPKYDLIRSNYVALLNYITYISYIWWCLNPSVLQLTQRDDEHKICKYVSVCVWTVSLQVPTSCEETCLILRLVIPVVLSNNKNKLNGTYVYRHKHNYIPYSTFTITKVQLHVSAINVGHLQVVHEALNDKLYLHVSEELTVCWVGWVRDLVLCL